MKTLLYILLFNISAISFAQDPLLFETNWFLMELTSDGANVFIPNNGEINNVPLDFLEFGMSTQPCNLLSIEINDLTNSTFITSDWAILEYNCFLPETLNFEEIYFYNFFQIDLIGQTFNYQLELGANDTRMLTITNPEGDVAIYGNAALSIQDNTLSQFTLFPNPAKNELFLNSKSTRGNLNVKIFNIEGKLLSTQTVAHQDQTSIDVSQLLSGLYFLNIEDKDGNTEVKKFLKE